MQQHGVINTQTTIAVTSGAPHTTGRMTALDTIRAFATAAVFLFHAGYLLTFAESDVFTRFTSTGGINWHHFVYELGTVGVSVFFVLSGFLLFYQLCKNDEPLTVGRLKEYVKKRLFRILPLYYFSLFFIVLVLRHDILSASGGLKSIAYNLVFLRSIKNADGSGGTLTQPKYAADAFDSCEL